MLDVLDSRELCAWSCIVLSLCQGCNQPTAGFQGHWHLVASASNIKTKMGKLFRQQKKIIAALRSEKLDNNKISKCGNCSIQDKVISHSDHSVSRAPCLTTVPIRWSAAGQNGTAEIGAVKAIDTLFAQFHVFNIFQQKTSKDNSNRWRDEKPRQPQDVPRWSKMFMIQDVFFGISSYHFEIGS